MKLIKTLLAAMCLFVVGQISAQASWNDFDALFAMSATDKGGGGTSTTTGSPHGGGGSGGGSNQNAIKVDWPKTGTMAMTKTIIKWDKVGKAPYMVSISDGDQTIFSAATNSNSLAIDLSALDLNERKDYDIKIADKDNRFKSNPIKVRFKPLSDLETLLDTLNNDPKYSEANGVKKGLMKAFYLEENGWNYEASQAYNIPTDDKEEMIHIINMYNLFRSRL